MAKFPIPKNGLYRTLYFVHIKADKMSGLCVSSQINNGKTGLVFDTLVIRQESMAE